MGKRRSKLEILLDIIKVCNIESKPTRIMYGTNTNWKQIERDLADLCAKGFIVAEDTPIKKSGNQEDNRTRVRYHATPKGMKFQKRMREIIDFMVYDRAKNMTIDVANSKLEEAISIGLD